MQLDREVGVAPVVVPGPGVDGGVGEEGVTEVALEGGAPLDLGDHGGVEADADVEQEVPPVDVADADRADAARPGPERGQQLAGGLDGVVGHADGAGEDVGRPARQDTEGAVGAGQPVGGLVEGAVAAEHDDGVGPVGRRALGQPGGVAPPAGLGHA